MRTRVLTDAEPLDNLLKGAEVLYKAVSTTMGPLGNNVIFRKNGASTLVTHDGVTVANAVEIDNAAQDVGADLLREAAKKLDGTTGDGTTTVTVLAYHMIKEASKLIKEGANPQRLRLELEKAAKEVIFEIKDLIIDPSEKLVEEVAITAAGSEEIGKEVGVAIYKAGKDTPVVLGVAEGGTTSIETINGFKINSGPASPYLMEGAGFKLEIIDPSIVVVDATLRTKEDIIPILQTFAALPADEHKFLLVCTDVTSDALSLLVVNRLKGFGEIAVVRVPQGIVAGSAYLQDVAIATGAKVLSRNTGHSIASPSPEDFGSAERVVVELDNTVIVNGRANPEEFKTHIESLKAAKKAEKNTQFMRDRLATMEQKIVSIRVGGQSETEVNERNYRYEDAVGATKAALKGGVLPGGGTVLYCLGCDTSNQIMGKALKAPLQKVLANAGLKVPKGIKIGLGVDVFKPELGLVHMLDRGIVDPAQSEIEAIKTAVTIAGLLLTSGALIVDEKEPSDEKTPAQFGLN